MKRSSNLVSLDDPNIFNVTAAKVTTGTKMKKAIFGGTFSVTLGCILHHNLVSPLEKYRQLNEVSKLFAAIDDISTDRFCPNPHMLLTMMQSISKEGMERVFWSDIHKQVLTVLHNSSYPVAPENISTLSTSANPNKKSRGIEGSIHGGNAFQRDNLIAAREKYEYSRIVLGHGPYCLLAKLTALFVQRAIMTSLITFLLISLQNVILSNFLL